METEPNLHIYAERPTSTILHTIELFAFYRIGGLDAVFKVADMFITSIDGITAKLEDARTENEKKELIQAYNGLRVVLSLLSPILSSKHIVESGQSHLISTKDKKDTDPDYFEPHNFLI